MVMSSRLRSRTTRVMFLTLLAICALALPAICLEPWRMVVKVQGKVESQRAGLDSWAPVFRSRVLSDGDMARTGENSRAKVQLADGSEFLVGASTTVEMTRFTLTPQGRIVVLTLKLGRVRAIVEKHAGDQSKFEVKTPNGVLAAHGTEFYVEQRAPGEKPASMAGDALAQADGPVADAPPPTAPTSPPEGNGNTFFTVFSGVVEATSGPTQPPQLFGPGNYGVILPNGQILFNPPGFPPAGPSGGGPDADLAGVGGPPPAGSRPPVDFMRPGYNTGVGGSTTGNSGQPPLMPGDVQTQVLQSTGNYPGSGTPSTGTIQIQIR